MKITRNIHRGSYMSADNFVFVALSPKSTAMVTAGWSVHITTFFLSKLEQAVKPYFVHILSLATNNNPP